VKLLFNISGRWYGSSPEYTLWKIKDIKPWQHPDERWQEIKLSREGMKRGEIVKLLEEMHPDWEIVEEKFTNYGEPEYWVTFEERKGEDNAIQSRN